MNSSRMRTNMSSTSSASLYKSIETFRRSYWGGPKPLHLKQGHLETAFFRPRCRLDGFPCLDSAFSVWTCDPDSICPVHHPKSGPRPEKERKRLKNGFWPHREKGSKTAEKWENWPINGSKMAIFPFSAIFPIFAAGPKSMFHPGIFFRFGPELGSVQVQMGRVRFV